MIGKRVKELRIKSRMSQQELGNAIGVTKVSVCGYENGSRIPNLEKLTKIADTFGTTTDYLLGREILVTNEENKTRIGSVSYEDVCFIMELRHYPNLYNQLLKDVKRSASLINKKFVK